MELFVTFSASTITLPGVDISGFPAHFVTYSPFWNKTQTPSTFILKMKMALHGEKTSWRGTKCQVHLPKITTSSVGLSYNMV